MIESEHIVALDETNFVQVVVEGSAQVPVLVDFWADWCGPCKSLMPILEKLAVEYDGRFILGKLDTDKHQGIAQQLGIRSLPTVQLFKDGGLVDQFMGAVPESEVRAFLDKHVAAAEAAAEPEEAGDPTIDQAMMLFESGQPQQARDLLQQAQAADPSNTEVLTALGQICVATGDLETARSCLAALPEEIRDGSAGKRLASMLALSENIDNDHDKQHWEQILAADPGNSQAHYQLAMHTAMANELQPAMDSLLLLLQRDPEYQDGAPRKTMLMLFDILGDDPMAGQYRRKMFAMLH